MRIEDYKGSFFLAFIFCIFCKIFFFWWSGWGSGTAGDGLQGYRQEEGAEMCSTYNLSNTYVYIFIYTDIYIYTRIYMCIKHSRMCTVNVPYIYI